MSSSNDSESEILLGNKHLLTIFFVIAVLLGVAFTGGYMVGRGASSDKKVAAAVPADAAASSQVASAPTSSVPTLSVSPDSSSATDTAQHDEPTTAAPVAARTVEPAPPAEEAPLNPRKSSKQAVAETQPTPDAAEASPKTGQTFLQVAAVRRTEADALAEVLRQKGFRAHSVQKPGSPDVFRVLIGPVRDTGDLSATRDSLRNTGFTKVIVQRY